MLVDDFEKHLSASGLAFEPAAVGAATYLVIKDVSVSGGTHAGKTCNVAIKRTTENPWVPESAVHVKPHLVPMGQVASQGSPLGEEWQYLSRRFDRPPTPRSFLAHIFTVLAEL